MLPNPIETDIINGRAYTVEMHLGSSFCANGGAANDENNRIKNAWSNWRERTGVLFNRNIPTKLKDKMYNMAIKPVILYPTQQLQRGIGNCRQLKCEFCGGQE